MVTLKPILPILGVQYSNLPEGGNTGAKFKVGPLKCRGEKEDKAATSCKELRYFLSVL